LNIRQRLKKEQDKLKGMYRAGRPSVRFRWVLGVYAIVFLGGGLRHGYDILTAGFLPPSAFPPALQLYWDALFFFDLVTVALIRLHWRAAVLLAMAIMATDVTANVYAAFLLHAPWLLNLFDNLPFILFAVFVYATAPLLLKEPERSKSGTSGNS
jgi:hypothetical protein